MHQNIGEKQQINTEDLNSRERSNENLKPLWQKGQSGNPAGRPKKEKIIQPHLEDCLNKKADKFPQTESLAKELGLDPSKCTVGYLLAHTAVMHALKGKQIQFQEILNRMDGKVKEQIFHEITPKLYGIDAPVDEV